MEIAWFIIVGLLILGVLAFLLGLYLIVRKITNKASDVLSEIPKDVIKESFAVGKELFKDKQNKTK